MFFSTNSFSVIFGYLLNKHIFVKTPVSNKVCFGESQRIGIIKAENRDFINSAVLMNDIFMSKSMRGIITNHRVPIVFMEYFQLDREMNNFGFQSQMSMPDTAIIGRTSEKFLFLEHKNIIPKPRGFVNGGICSYA